MAIGYRGNGGFTNRSSAGTSPLSVPVPAGTAAGDLLLLVASCRAVSVSTPSGWTLIATKTAWGANNTENDLFYKVAGASEGAVSVNTTASSLLDCVVLGFTGVDTTTPIDATAAWSAVLSTNPVTVPSITTATANACWVVIGADTSGVVDASSFPSGWTQRVLTSIFMIKYVASSVIVASPGATSATSYPRTATGASHVLIGIALRDASGGGGGSTFVPRIVIT